MGIRVEIAYGSLLIRTILDDNKFFRKQLDEFFERVDYAIERYKEYSKKWFKEDEQFEI